MLPRLLAFVCLSLSLICTSPLMAQGCRAPAASSTDVSASNVLLQQQLSLLQAQQQAAAAAAAVAPQPQFTAPAAGFALQVAPQPVVAYQSPFATGNASASAAVAAPTVAYDVNTLAALLAAQSRPAASASAAAAGGAKLCASGGCGGGGRGFFARIFRPRSKSVARSRSVTFD